MRDERGSHCQLRLTVELDWFIPRYRGFKRKANLDSHLHQCDVHHYPSPPMSNPPTPPGVPQERHASPSRVPRVVDADATSVATSPPMPTAATIGPSHGPPLHLPRELSRFGHTPPTTISSQSLQSLAAYSAAQAQHSLDSHGTQLPPTTDGASTGSSAAQKAGRKSKAHVASACINCKRAHLSCDVNRPCTRCISSGKQDSCIDVQHKKRGRPRLREEGSFNPERAVPQFAHPPALQVSDPTLHRPIAAPRARRAESFRSLRSQDSDASLVPVSPPYSYHYPSHATAASFEHRYSAQPTRLEVPTAYLDMDLVILKANDSFCQIMSIDPRAHAGTHLSEVAVAVDGQSFPSIRADLRLERERREPTYMPPIAQPGQDGLGGASLDNVERYAHGSDDRNYMWTLARPGESNDHFIARLRLAKAQAWFAALTLPSFALGPAREYPSPMVSSLAAHRYPSALEYSTTPHHFATHSAPAAMYAPVAYETPLPAPHRPPGHQPTRSYPPPQPPLPYSQQAQRPTTSQRPLQGPPNILSFGPQPGIPTPRMTAAPSGPSGHTPRSAPRELPPSHDSIPPTGIQLPPMLGNPTATAGPATSRAQATSASDTFGTESATRSGHTSGDDESQSPRKRRKLNLTDVLHND